MRSDSLKVCGNVEGFRAGQQETTQSSGLGRSLPLLCLLLPPPLPPPLAKAVSVFHSSLPLLVVGCPDQTSQRCRLPPGFWGCCLNRLTGCQGWKGLRNHLEQPPPCSKGNRGREGARDCPRAPRGRAKAKCLDFMTAIFTGAQHQAMLRKAKQLKGLVSATKARPGLASVQTRGAATGGVLAEDLV